MKSENQEKLFKKYPKIFCQKDLSMQETCMCWGIDCGDGWYKILEMLCFQLQFDTDRNNYPQVEATQVKEKFGGLRFYYIILASDKKDKYRERHCGAIDGMISFTEFLSQETCEICGSMENVIQTKGWIKSLCKNCIKKE